MAGPKRRAEEAAAEDEFDDDDVEASDDDGDLESGGVEGLSDDDDDEGEDMGDDDDGEPEGGGGGAPSGRKLELQHPGVKADALGPPEPSLDASVVDLEVGGTCGAGRHAGGWCSGIWMAVVPDAGWAGRALVNSQAGPGREGATCGRLQRGCRAAFGSLRTTTAVPAATAAACAAPRN